MLIGFLIVAAFLLALALIVARVTGGYVGTSIVMGILGAIVTFLTLMPFVFLSALGIVAVGMRCHTRDLSYRRYLIETCSVTFFFTLLACLYAGSKVKKQTDMAAQYPFESISDRLAYEKENKPSKAFPQPHLDFTDKTSQVTDNRSHESASNLTDIESQIENIESSWQARRRVRSLQAFHANYVTQFVNAPGFGIGRGSALAPSIDYVPLEDPAPIPLPFSEYDYSDKLASETVNTEGTKAN
ncbi:MAG TPA: hypothetical protein VGZ25_14890, partial [Gemmataceae bacterium]|nr:hypothetical protein [Gemmataceae bacterium]